MSRAEPTRRPPRSGFSMAELLMAVAIIAVIAGLALPKWDTLPSRADAGMRLVRGALQQAQRTAIQHQHDMVVSFDLPGRRVRIAEDSTDDGRVDEGERDRWISLDETVVFARPPQAVPDIAGAVEVAGPGVRTVEGLPSVVFRRNGAASGDVAIYIAATRGARRELRAVTVLHTTGRTDWYRYRETTGWTRGDL